MTISNLPPLDSLSKDLIFPAVDKSKSPEQTVQVSLDQLVALSAGPRGPAGVPGTAGPSGPSGPAGLNSTVSGFSGISGFSGTNGLSGISGYSGSTGPSGFSGRNGINGLSGTSGYSGVIGQSGTSGFSGESGRSGRAGISGFSGQRGASGTSGFSGESGASGQSGINGISGQSGQSGFSGESGTSGHSGLSGYSGRNGATGLPGLSGQSGTSGLSGASGYSGERGAAGDPGANGLSGFSGERGIDGASGISGFSGHNGADGTSGFSGFSGASGLPGTAVEKGDSGFSGYSGAQGFSGFSGYSGRDGRNFNSGYSGVSGYSGINGESGISGYSGIEGLSGVSGSSGKSGHSGESGYSGTSGSSGFSGLNGSSGFSGLPGESGYSGYSGFSGASGVSGFSGAAGYGYLTVERFGAVGDAITDDSAAIQTALINAASFGGTVVIPNNYRCFIGSNINIPNNVTLKGPHEFVGTPEVSSSITNLGGALLVGSDAMITLNSNSGLAGLLIIQNQLSFPIYSLNFTGNAIQINNESNDSFVINSLVVGFETAVTAINSVRLKLEHFYYDTINGINLVGGSDFNVLNVTGFSEISNLEKPGVGLSASNTIGKSTIFNSKSKNYHTGFNLEDCSNVSLMGCDVYGVSTGTGFTLSGNSENIKYISCSAENNNDGWVINTLHQNKSTILDFYGKSNANNCIKISQGNLYATNGVIDTAAIGFSVETTSTVVIDYTRFINISSATIEISTVTSSLVIGNHNDFGVSSASNYVSNTANVSLPVAAVNDEILQLPLFGNAFTVASTSSVASIVGGWTGRSATLLFDEPITIISNIGNNFIKLSNNDNFITNTGSSITLIYNGVQWFEISRSV